MPRPIQALVFPRAVAYNLAVVRHNCPHSKCWAVVKANGYGHGLERIYPGLAGADGAALLDFDEAVRLRDLGWDRPILLLEGFFDASDLTLVKRLALTPVVHCEEQLRMLEIAARSLVPAARNSKPIDVYLKLNSGMNRLGFRADAFRAAHARLRALESIGEITLMSHLANADNAIGAESQIECFDRATAGLHGARSLANSAAILAHPAAHHDWVRPGIMMYGATPFSADGAASFGLRAAMRLTSEIIAVQSVLAGEGVGYGNRFVADRPMRVGVVACGYADGYPRSAPNGTPVAVGPRGKRRRTVMLGRVSMDMIVIDLSDLPDAGVGSEVELWGETVAVDEVARTAGTVGYELLCALAPRVPVRVVDEDKEED